MRRGDSLHNGKSLTQRVGKFGNRSSPNSNEMDGANSGSEKCFLVYFRMSFGMKIEKLIKLEWFFQCAVIALRFSFD